eukprot:TRINITY_DN20902_c0_g1_i1.p1 TRINITY_DN20902_c0_g1~~TRINITY_DN20902_c0_g1_i1.p1  ORF type:complete len:203 (+),score=36.16 TRINITY_DN20902_c0_g1_i1:28-636(+)
MDPNIESTQYSVHVRKKLKTDVLRSCCEFFNLEDLLLEMKIYVLTFLHYKELMKLRLASKLYHGLVHRYTSLGLNVVAEYTEDRSLILVKNLNIFDSSVIRKLTIWSLVRRELSIDEARLLPAELESLSIENVGWAEGAMREYASRNVKSLTNLFVAKVSIKPEIISSLPTSIRQLYIKELDERELRTDFTLPCTRLESPTF